MELMQFTAVVLLTLLMLKLLLLPRKVAVNPTMGMARWLMIAGIALLDLQFLLQFTLGLRAMGVTQAVMLNIVLFVPASWTISLSILYLQQRGRVSIIDKVVGGVIWAITLAILGIAAAIDGQPLLSDTKELHYAEIAASIIFLGMQNYYSRRHVFNLRSMRQVLQNYYDRNTDGMLRWMQLSILVLMVMAIMAPLLIFVKSKGLALFGILFFVGIFFLVDSFCSYVVSSAPRRIEEAEENEDYIMNDDKTLSPDTAIELWIEKGGFCQNGITMPAAAEAIGIPRYMLKAWIKEHYTNYADWMTDLRIEEAKRVIIEHPDWNNEIISDHCGFTDRSYFQRKFKEKTGITPSQYHQQG